MKNPGNWILGSTTAALLGGCAGIALWGELVVLGITVAIFFGTLSLGGKTHPVSSSDEASESQRG